MILHIANDFNLTKVHKELYSNLDILGIKQKIFTPLRVETQIGSNHFPFTQDDSEYIYSDRLKKYHKIFFNEKINFLYKSLISKIDCKQITLTHATTLFSDGAIAYRLFKDYGIPYIVAVRNTDLNIYFKYRKNLIGLGKKILLNAQKVVFISDSNRFFFNNLSTLKNIKKVIENKSKVINNGIDDFWLDNVQKFKKRDEGSFNFLFIGRFDSNKNVELLIDALKIFKNSSKNPVKLNLIGGTGNRHDSVLKKIAGQDWIQYHGQIFSKEELKNHYSANDFFSMISHTETFGLVYMEALSQGLPLLYTKNQGVDQAFTFNFGKAVDSKKINNIVLQLEELCRNEYPLINDIDFEEYRWSNIAIKYLKIYNENN